MNHTKIRLFFLVLCFVFSPNISSAEDADYIVRVTYDGHTTLDVVDVFLYDATRACDTVLESPYDPPSGDIAWTSLVILPDAEGNIPDRALSVPRDVTLHYAVARATASDHSGGGSKYYVTFGCNDQIVHDPDGATVIEVDMHNLYEYTGFGVDLDADNDGDIDGVDLSVLAQYFGALRYFKDSDGDGFSDGTTLYSTSQPTGYILESELTAIIRDCDDTNAGVNPGVNEYCWDSFDNDCDGKTDFEDFECYHGSSSE